MDTTPDDLADLMTIAEASAALDVDRATVYRWLRDPDRPLTPVRAYRRYRIGQPVLRVLRSEVQALLATTPEQVAS